MATHYSVLACSIPGTEEPSGLPSMGSHRVGHDWSTIASAAAANLIKEVENSRHSIYIYMLCLSPSPEIGLI